jgi:hypothetical protein
MYLYKAVTYHNTSAVISVPASNTADNSDFVTNYKATAIPVDALEVAETTFVTELSYANFKAEVAAHAAWSAVKYIVGPKSYELYLLSDSSLL